MIILIITSLLVILILLKYKPKITYVSYDEFVGVLEKNDYFKRMAFADLSARKVLSCEEYLEKYISGIVSYTPEEKQKLEELVSKANVIIPFKNLTWKFAKISSSLENGNPHTFSDIIVFNSDALNSHIALDLIIHEQIHLLQRRYPQVWQELFSKLNLHKYSLRTKFPLLRNNPDVDLWVYSYNGRPFGTINGSEFLNVWLDDFTPSFIQEHPNEILAYKIVDTLFGRAKNEIILEWMKTLGNFREPTVPYNPPLTSCANFREL